MIYFDNGATTYPKPQSVINAVNNAMRLYAANPGRSGHSMSIKAAEKVFECRQNAAKLFNSKTPENVIFTNNCTMALNTVIKGVLNNGDHAVISSLEHNAVVRPLEFLKNKGVDYSVADFVFGDDEATIDNFRKAIRDNTRLVICTHASNVFGVTLPVERIAALCRIYGILFCTDAAQTAGVIDYDLQNSSIDFLCTAGHKSLYGPMGTGLLIINSDNIPESLIQGGTGSQSANLAQPELLPDKFESGTPNLSGICGLNEGIKFVIKKTPQKLLKDEIYLAARLYDNLSRIKGVILYTQRPDVQRFVPVISFNIEGMDSEETAQILNNRYNIATRAGLHCAPLAHNFFNTENTGTVRAVMSAFTTVQNVDYFSACVRKISALKKY